MGPSINKFKSFAVSVTTTRGQISTSLPRTDKGYIIVPVSGTIYVGGDDVTTANGYPVPSTGLSLDSADLSQLYAIAGSTLELRVLVLF